MMYDWKLSNWVEGEKRKNMLYNLGLVALWDMYVLQCMVMSV